MTVAELIAALAQLNPESVVRVIGDTGWWPVDVVREYAPRGNEPWRVELSVD